LNVVKAEGYLGRARYFGGEEEPGIFGAIFDKGTE
jgi:hypothetical protein